MLAVDSDACRHAVLVFGRGSLSVLAAAAIAGAAGGAPRPAPLPPIVFASRAPIAGESGRPEAGAVPGLGPRDRIAAPGGRLLVRDTDGSVRVLVDAAALADVADPCVSWDGTRIVFSGLAHPDSAWRIYVVAADGTGLRAITRTDRNVSLAQFGAAAARFERYDDFDPCWLPDGRICFASTRYPMVAQFGDHMASNLFVVGEEGGQPNRITTERSGGEEPVIDPLSGRVVFARWWLNVDRPSNITSDGLTFDADRALTLDVGNLWQIVSVTPDGRGARLHAGDPRSRAGLMGYKPTLLADGRVLGLAAANPSLSPGPGAMALRVFPASLGPGRALLGALLAETAPLGEDTVPDPGVSVADAVPLPDGRLLVAYAPGRGDFGLYRCTLDDLDLELVVDLPGTHELDAAVLAPSRVPPVLPDEIATKTPVLPPTEDPRTFEDSGTFRFDCLNVYMNAPVDAPIPNAPSIAPGTRIRLFINFQRQNPLGHDPSILFRDSELTKRGAVAEQGIPANVPLFGQLVDAEGRLLVDPEGTPAHVNGYGFGRHGGWAQCVGCHTGHSAQTIPNNFSGAEWFNVSTSARVEASSAWVPEGGTTSPCTGARVVDRRAREDSIEVAWVAAGARDEFVHLRWPMPIEVSHFVVYGIRPNRRARTDVRVDDCRITLYLGDEVVGRVAATGRIDPDGTTVHLPAPLRADAARIEPVSVRGRVRGQRLAGLAEVETMARLALE